MIADHKFEGREVPQEKRALVGKYGKWTLMPWGSSCGRCGAEWYEHLDIKTNVRALRAIALADCITLSAAAAYCLDRDSLVVIVNHSFTERGRMLPPELVL